MYKNIIILMALIIALSGCSGIQQNKATQLPKKTQPVLSEFDLENSPLNNLRLSENKSVYTGDIPNETVGLYLTVKPGKDKAGRLVYTFDMLNGYGGTGDEPEVDVIAQEGQEGTGPLVGLFGFDESIPNGALTLRGNVERMAQRSYKIKLYNRAGLWRGQKTINLNKHLNDLSRMKSKLFYDFIAKLPDIAGFRTQFVHVYIKDTTKEQPDRGYQDYGLFTHIENPNKDYLRSRGFDIEGNLYKAENFNFERQPDIIKDEADPSYDKKKMEKLIIHQEGTGNSKLIKMLDELGDKSRNINDIVSRHFNRDNLLTYIAVNLILGNINAVNSNYILYNAKNAMTWYFIPWGGDDILSSGIGTKKNMPPDSLYGAYLFSDNLLFQRFFSDKNNLADLEKKVDEISQTVNAGNTSAMVNSYKNVIYNSVYKLPDLAGLPKSADLVDDYIDSLPKIVEENKVKFKKSIKLPLPALMHDIKEEGSNLILSWLPSQAADGKGIKYNVDIATDLNFTNLVFTQKDITQTTATTPKPQPGAYYWRVISVDSAGNTQLPGNIYTNPFGKRHYGVSQIRIK